MLPKHPLQEAGPMTIKANTHLQRNLPGTTIVLSLETSVSFQLQVLLGPEIQPRAIWSFKAEAGVRIRFGSPKLFLRLPFFLDVIIVQLFPE